MNINFREFSIGNFFKRLLIAIVMTILFCILVHLENIKLQILVILIVAVTSYLLSHFIIKFDALKKFYIVLSGIYAVLLIVITVMSFGNIHIKEPYDSFQNIETNFFKNKNVLILVPHQDDELNLAGDIIKEYKENNSKVSVVFCTNGDYYGLSETRFLEAIDVMKQCNVPEKDVYFLGFGDQWKAVEYNGQTIKHIYNSPKNDMVWESVFGSNKTYDTKAKSCYKYLPYTRDSYLSSIVDLINEIKPDTIFATDTDDHIDHRAASYFFEEAMAKVLKEDENYHPNVFKGYCYTTAWNAVDDYYNDINILSTKKHDDMEAKNDYKPYYEWNDRVRIPVYCGGLDRILSNTDSFKALDLYTSQSAFLQSGKVTNGDKVFGKEIQIVFYITQKSA